MVTDWKLSGNGQEVATMAFLGYSDGLELDDDGILRDSMSCE